MNAIADTHPQPLIEQADLSHLGEIMEIENACFGPDSFSRRQMAYLISKAKGAFFVIREAGKVLAYISLVHRANASNLRIYSVAVHPSARGRGLAQALIHKSVEYAYATGLRSITLEVDTENTPAIALYAKNGFYTTAFLLGYYHHGNGFRMKKEL